MFILHEVTQNYELHPSVLSLQDVDLNTLRKILQMFSSVHVLLKSSIYPYYYTCISLAGHAVFHEEVLEVSALLRYIQLYHLSRTS